MIETKYGQSPNSSGLSGHVGAVLMMLPPAHATATLVPTLSLVSSGVRLAHAGWMLALRWNRFWGSYFPLILASRWYFAGP